jgi:uncharacterized membrane protein
MTFSGVLETGGTNKAIEFYTIGSGWTSPFDASWTPDLYPRLHLLPSGKVFYAGAQTKSKLFDPSTNTWNTNFATTNYGGLRTYGSSVLLPLSPADNYDSKVLIMGGGNPSTNTTEIIDFGSATPSWQYGPAMSQARIEMNAVILPNGKVLALGGSLFDEESSTASFNADLFDPATNTFSPAGVYAYARLYHSVALLLPDATVWSAGGNPTRGHYVPQQEIYKPAYLFKPDGSPATRPSITGAPSSISYNDSFTVQTPDAANISHVVLVRNGSVTHAFGMDQRLVDLTFVASNGSLTVTAPPNGNIAPPGYYMLFLLNNSGVPSIAPFLQLMGPPTFRVASPASVSISQGNQGTATITTSVSGGFNSAISLSVSGAPSGTTGTFNPATIAASGAGTSTMNIAVGSSTPVGSYPLTITLRGGGIQQTATVNLIVGHATVATPVFSPIGGRYLSAQSVTITDATPGAAIHYTTNGATPTTASPLYTAPIAVASTETLKAMAVASGYSNSSVATATFTIAAAVPVFSPKAGTYTSIQSVTISDATAGAAIYYTTDGTTPTTASSPYAGPITVSSTQTIKAIAAAPGYSNSAVGTALYTIAAVAPVFSPKAGTYTAALSVSMTDATPGASIYYTTDGSKPTTSSTLYSGPITIATTQVVQAIAVATGYANSSVASASYVIAVPTPIFSPKAGTYTSAQSVAITDSMAGAAIHYTTDGSSPTPASNLYTGPLTVSSTTTLKAIAVGSGYSNSAVASGTFTIAANAP